MNTINLYKRPQIRQMLEEFGFGIELFENWNNAQKSFHGHDVLEMNYILRGRAVQSDGQSGSAIRRGILTVINYGLEHSIETDAEGIDIINIYIDIARVRLPELDEDLTAVLRNVIPLHPITVNNLNKVLEFEMLEPRIFEDILLAMLNEKASASIGRAAAIRQYFTLFLIHLCRGAQLSGFCGLSWARGAQKIETLLKYLEDNCHKHLVLSQIADVAGMDKHYLCREFKRITGTTVFQYLLSRRLQKAMYELRTTQKKIIDTALDSGFGNISNFNRVFRQLTNTTPSQYRKKSAFAAP